MTQSLLGILFITEVLQGGWKKKDYALPHIHDTSNAKVRFLTPV